MRGLIKMRLVLTVVVLAGCDAAPPVKTAKGEQIDGVAIEERFALANDVKESSLRGDRLRSAVEIMDRRGVMSLTGTYAAKGVVDSGTVTIVIRPTNGAERRVVVKNCAQPSVCGFFDEAVSKGLMEHKPVACQSTAPCDKS